MTTMILCVCIGNDNKNDACTLPVKGRRKGTVLLTSE